MVHCRCARDGIFEIFWSQDFLKIFVPGFFGPEISPFWEFRDFLFSKNPGTKKSRDFQNGKISGPNNPGTKIFKKSWDQKISKIPSCAHPYYILFKFPYIKCWNITLLCESPIMKTWKILYVTFLYYTVIRHSYTGYRKMLCNFSIQNFLIWFIGKF